MGRFKVKMGSSFEVDEVELGDVNDIAKVAHAAEAVAEATTRAFVVKALVSAVLVALLGAAAIGLFSGEFGHLKSVWLGVGPMVGAVIGHYFRAGKETQ